MQKVILNTASQVRQILQIAPPEPGGYTFRSFPKGACGETSELLCRAYVEFNSIDAKCVYGYNSDLDCNHAWVEASGFIIDITADQFGQPPVIVTSTSLWHKKWVVEHQAAHCTHENWPLYPHHTWSLIQRKLSNTPICERLKCKPSDLLE